MVTSLTVPQGELRLIWRDILGYVANISTIGADTDFFAAGGTLLLLARLQNAVKERMGVDMPLQELYQANTLDKMAAVLNHERSYLGEDRLTGLLRRQCEEEVLEGATVELEAVDDLKRTGGKRIILTGATSFFSSEILGVLLQEPDVETIHCVAVPPRDRQKLPQSDRIVIYVRSLLSHTLGLTSAEKALLARTADGIIHARSQGHCLNNYTSVRQANFMSTQFLVQQVALPRRIPRHFISSPRVILKPGSKSCSAPPVSMAAYTPAAPRDSHQASGRARRGWRMSRHRA